jgi:hypothetical protein
MAATTRRAATFLVLALTALALGGCAVFRVNPAALQAGTVGDVTVHLDVCASNVGSCPATGDAEADQSAANSYDLQMLLGFLVPDGVDAPATFDTSSGPAGTFARNDSYTAGLAQLQAAPAGFRWVGYSAKTTYHWHYPSSPATEFTADPAFHLHPGTDGSPFHGPFTYRVVVGVRAVDASHTLASALNCTGSHASTQTICSDEAAGATPLASDISIPTRDLGVLAASAPASTTPGGAVSVPFTLRYAGAATPAASFALSAVSNLPGAALPTLSAPSVQPATDSDSTVLATVGVPAGTAPGDYTVTLTAALPNGQSRTGTRTVSVVPVGDGTPPPPNPPDGTGSDTRAPVASVTIRAERLSSLIKTRKLRVRAAIDEPGTLALSTKVAGHSLRSTVRFKKSGGRTVVLRISKATAKALRRRSRLKLTVKGSARDLAGNTTAAHSSRTLTR